MRQWLFPFSRWSAERKANGLASLIALFAGGILYFEFPPTPAGANAIARGHAKARPVLIAETPAVVQAMASIRASADSTAVEMTPVDRAQQALQLKMSLLEKGRTFLESIPDYTAEFCKQELVNGELLEEQTIHFKCRHHPFSVYLKWEIGDEGREVLYTDGQNDNEMVVHGGGWKARLPALSISPTSSLALKESRYPITNVGLLELAKMMLSVHQDDIAKKAIARCEKLADQEFDGRMCDVFLVEYRDANVSPTYRKSITLIDKEWHIPVYARNFGWPNVGSTTAGEQLDEETLVEYYTYADIQFRQQLAEVDFDRTNEDYRFK